MKTYLRFKYVLVLTMMLMAWMPSARVMASNAFVASLSHEVFYDDELKAAKNELRAQASELYVVPVPTDGLIAYYPLNSNANDESGNGYHATPCNSYQFEDGIVGGCITVEGQGYMESSGGHVLLPQFDFDASSGVTLSLWVKAKGMTVSDGEAYISLGDHTAHDGLLIIQEPNNSSVSFQYHDSRVDVPYLEEYTGKWVMYTLTCDVDGKMKAYVNGAIAGEEDVDYDGQISTSYAALGRHWWNYGSDTSTRFSGSFDEVRIYNRALSQKEVQALYNESPYVAPVPTDGLVAYYPLNSNANDESGNGYHATPCNSYQFEDGIVGGCITVEGQGYMENSGGHVLLPQFDFDASSGVTLSLWVKAKGMTVSDGEAYISLGDHTAHDGLLIIQEPDINSVSFQYHDSRVDVPYLEEYTGKWVMYTLACGADGKMKAYVNGAIAGEEDVDYDGQISTSYAALGRHWWNYGSDTSTRFSGSFDEVRIYNRALSQKEVQALYNEGEQGGVSPDDPTPNTDLSQIANTVYMNRVEVHKGTQTEIAIRMKNTAEIRGFQFDLYLPDGVTVMKRSSGKYMAALCQERLDDGDTHTLTVSLQDDGALRFLCGSLDDEAFLGNDGDIITLTVEVSDNMADGNHTVALKKIKLTETDINQHYDTAELQSVITVVSYVVGDISGDGEVDVSDYIGIANAIMGNPQADFNERAADVNGDGIVDVSDYIGVANLILYGNIYGQ